MNVNQLMVNWWFGLVGGLDSWDPLMKGIVTYLSRVGYPLNPKPPTQTTNLPFVERRKK